MFQDTDLLNIFGPALIGASILLLLMSFLRNKKEASELSKALDHLKITSIVFGALLVLLWLSLPSTPALKSFGYPQDITAIKNDSQLLNMLQEYNRAIVRTTEVLQWFLFLFIWWFLTALFGVLRAYKQVSKQGFA